MNPIMDRKKRRGYIEKKRRDRLNNCLIELKRLVPQASRRELSEKLEKADILQLTVDYLNNLEQEQTTSGVDLEIDYKDMGFRDCIFEVSRFFCEMDDTQNPFHLRLVSHLQYFTGPEDGIGSKNETRNKHVCSREQELPAVTMTAMASEQVSYMLNYQAFLLTLAKALCDQNTNVEVKK